MADPFDQGLDVVRGIEGGQQELPGQNEWGPQSGQQGSPQYGGQQQGGGLLGGALNGVRGDVQNQINQAIDHFASQIPGGEQHSEFAKNAVNGVLDELQRRLESQAASSMGGFGGSLFGNNPGSTGNQGGSL
ncbi:MAG TPA: hypothetical protein VFA41_21630 [Ktedonobacteraceae bacterium]|jgi:hypothetical protein|nr:hypothetical protein [Ktedonobacteraceae bacterium]